MKTEKECQRCERLIEIESKMFWKYEAPSYWALVIFIILLVAVALFAFGCSQAPTAPDPVPAAEPPFHVAQFWDPLQPEGWTADSTNMHHYHNLDGTHIDDSLVVYFAAHFTQAVAPELAPWYCWYYGTWYEYFDQNDEFVYLLVREYERYRCDIPKELDIQPPC